MHFCSSTFLLLVEVEGRNKINKSPGGILTGCGRFSCRFGMHDGLTVDIVGANTGHFLQSCQNWHN